MSLHPIPKLVSRGVNPATRAAPPKPPQRVKLTQKTLNAMESPSEETWLWDTEIRGFFLRVYPTGLKTFAVKYRNGGRQKVFTIGKYGSPWTVEKARQRASELLYEAQHGADPQAAKLETRSAKTVAELIELYLRDGPKDKPNKRPRSWDNDRLHLNRHVLPLVGPLKAHALTSADVASLQADIADGKTAITTKTKKRGVARVRGGRRAAAVSVVCLQAMYNWAMKRKLVATNPAKGVTRYETDAKERYLSIDEIGSLLRKRRLGHTCCSPRFPLMLRLRRSLECAQWTTQETT